MNTITAEAGKIACFRGFHLFGSISVVVSQKATEEAFSLSF
jgi:hypothetical protein